MFSRPKFCVEFNSEVRNAKYAIVFNIHANLYLRHEKTRNQNPHFLVKFGFWMSTTMDRKGLQEWFTYHFMWNLINFNLIPPLGHLLYHNLFKKIKTFPYPLILAMCVKVLAGCYFVKKNKKKIYSNIL